MRIAFTLFFLTIKTRCLTLDFQNFIVSLTVRTSILNPRTLKLKRKSSKKSALPYLFIILLFTGEWKTGEPSSSERSYLVITRLSVRSTTPRQAACFRNTSTKEHYNIICYFQLCWLMRRTESKQRFSLKSYFGFLRWNFRKFRSQNSFFQGRDGFLKMRNL